MTSAAPDKREQALGWIFAAVMAVHVIILQPQAAVELTAFAVLLAGAVLRASQVYPPTWLAQLLLLLSAVAVVLAQSGHVQIPLLGEMAATVGTMMLLRPMTPVRSLRFLFCLLIILVAVILKPYANVGRVFLIGDAAVLFILAEQAFRPAEVSVSLWVSLMRSLRVIVPVGLIVLGIFWLFPSLSIYSITSLPGFSGSTTLNPGDVASMAQSRMVAMTAHFAEGQPVPSAAANYWRGQVLDRNEGLVWTVVFRQVNREQILQTTPPAPSSSQLKYSQALPSNRGGIVPVLDHAVYVEAKRDGQEIAVLDRGADVLSAVGAGSLTLDVTSSMQRLTDAPPPEIEDGYTSVPKSIRESSAMAGLVAKIFAEPTDTPGKLRAVGHYLSHSGFQYTTRPGRIQDLERFLVTTKQGFCEHYAAASANLLRLAGVPTRVVTGFRGGEWNPYLRTITVRDSDAHAWVEAWDATAHRWLRFDPTDYVAPDIAAAIQREMDSAKWPAYHRGWSYSIALMTEATDYVGRTWDRFTSFEAWENTPTVLFIALVGVALAWLVRNILSRRAAITSHENIARLLADLERRAGRFRRERKAGETPLAWLARLREAAAEPSERETLRRISATYESGMYKAGAPGAELIAELRQQMARLVGIWKNRPAAQ